VYRLAIDYAAASYGIAQNFGGANQEVDGQGRSQLRRIVSMLT
jgi:hypothetical protein